MQIVTWFILLCLFAWFAGMAGFVLLCVYYEWRRRDRIRKGLPLEDTREPGRGFPVQNVVLNPPQAGESER